MKQYKFFLFLYFLISFPIIYTQEKTRETILFDEDWRFALGHAYDAGKDFNHGTSYFSFYAKTGYGDGPAAANFDDRAWRVLDLPHDWCVELPFDSRGGHSHGYKAIGRNFPQNSVGWYRKKFFVPESDLGKKIFIHFEGVHRDAIVFVNGFYCGRNHSGYYGFEYDITDYLNYNGDNIISVRVDATMEEGWYYEGAGIYRHVWLIKTNPLHVAKYGTFITTDLNKEFTNARITSRTTINNETNEIKKIDLEENILNAEGKIIARNEKKDIQISEKSEKELYTFFSIDNPILWSLENPYLHTLKTIVKLNGKIIDEISTRFGIRSIKFDSEKGFFLNGKNIKIKGTNNHQDHAGVGTAIPDDLQEYRIKKLKEMGSNAIRTSHNPPSPALLDACDKMGMLVLVENRLMGVNNEHLYYLKEMIMRDRNHPSVILWSLGNEEWAIEGNEKGKRITKTMQDFAVQLDSTRMYTAASSGGWDEGTGTMTQVMGYNYIMLGDIDQHHKKFPWQPAVGTEESNTIGTRGIYFTNEKEGRMAPTGLGTENGWKFYHQRPFLAGLFYWTGFDYRGEANPFGWPQVISQYGILDLCGFPKDIFYYLKSWWTDEPVLHIYPHWNWKGREGDTIDVVIYSNADEVELLLNNKKIGKEKMPFNGHLSWKVKYEKGILKAVGYKNGKPILVKTVETTDEPVLIKIESDKNKIRADGKDIIVVTISAVDNKGRIVPTANNEIYFSISGPGKIIGVGNGDAASHEKERFIDEIYRISINNLREHVISDINDTSMIKSDIDDSNWIKAFSIKHKDWHTYVDTLIVVRGDFEIDEFNDTTTINLFTKSILENQSIFVNGHRIATNIKRDDPNQSFKLEHKILKKGRNVIAFTGQRFRKKNQWDEPNTDPGLVQVIYPAEQWKRKLFNGFAQVIIQSTKESGEIIFTAESEGLKSAKIIINKK